MIRRLIPYLEAISVVLIWAVSPPLIKILLEDLTPPEIAGIRYVGAFIFIRPLAVFLFPKDSASFKDSRLDSPGYYGYR